MRFEPWATLSVRDDEIGRYLTEPAIRRQPDSRPREPKPVLRETQRTVEAGGLQEEGSWIGRRLGRQHGLKGLNALNHGRP